MRHQNEYLAAARLQWLGLWASELAAYVLLSLNSALFRPADTFVYPHSLGIGKDALLPITKHDEKKVSISP